MELISSSAEHIRIELESPWLLAEKLHAVVSGNWPSGEYDRDAMEFFLSCFEKGGEAVQGWYGWYAIKTDNTDGQRFLVGAAGYFGPPDNDGIVEVGYSVLPEWQRRGYATEMVHLLVSHAFTFATTRKIIAHTAVENEASIRVLISNGFSHAGVDEHKLRFELTRKHHSGSPTGQPVPEPKQQPRTTTLNHPLPKKPTEK
jgi:[ribosomal protein S5]-alanine N-acetyltransferase